MFNKRTMVKSSNCFLSNFFLTLQTKWPTTQQASIEQSWIAIWTCHQMVEYNACIYGLMDPEKTSGVRQKHAPKYQKDQKVGIQNKLEMGTFQNTATNFSFVLK